MTYDLVIRGGTVVDGTGVPATTADVAIDGDRVVEVGRVEGSARRELDADGLIVTPGFVDIHTHLDAQLSWDPLGSSSCWHGVTSVVLGNCGVTFAPVAPDGREFLAEMMESVEDVPAQSILDGLSWNWETYGEYLADLASLPKGLNVGGMVGHCAVRVAAMGERSPDEDPASAEALAALVPMVDEALAAGALGFPPPRPFLHRVPDGRSVPGAHAAEDELLAFADSLGRYGGIFECAAKLGGRNDPEGVFTRDEIRMYGDISRRAGCPVTFGLTQVDVVPSVLVVLAPQDRVGLFEHHPPVLLRDPHHLADDLQRQAGRHLHHEVAGSTLEQVVDHLSGDPLDGVLERPDASRREPGRDDRPQPPVAWIVHRDHRPEEAGQFVARQVHRGRPALAAAEVLRPTAGFRHVAVPHQGVVPTLRELVRDFGGQLEVAVGVLGTQKVEGVRTLGEGPIPEPRVRKVDRCQVHPLMLAPGSWAAGIGGIPAHRTADALRGTRGVP